MSFTLPDLPYDYAALEPVRSIITACPLALLVRLQALGGTGSVWGNHDDPPHQAPPDVCDQPERGI